MTKLADLINISVMRGKMELITELMEFLKEHRKRIEEDTNKLRNQADKESKMSKKPGYGIPETKAKLRALKLVDPDIADFMWSLVFVVEDLVKQVYEIQERSWNEPK